MSETTTPDIPRALPWDQRVSGVWPLPGGNDAFLDSLMEACHYVDGLRPSLADLNRWFEERYELTSRSADSRTAFLFRVGLLERVGDVCSVATPTRRWLKTRDDTALIAYLHSRTKFIGELLAELIAAQDSGALPTPSHLLDVAVSRYGFAWNRDRQVQSRRGWLQSAGLLTTVPRPHGPGKALKVTEAGRRLVRQLELHNPETVDAGDDDLSGSPDGESSESPQEATDSSHDADTPTDSSPIDPVVAADAARDLATELRIAAIDSGTPTRFESAVSDAFRYLGFNTESLGGSGNTDVLVEAGCGKSHSYRVVVEVKTSGKGRVAPVQVDFTTLQDHRDQQRAEYALLVGPKPTAQRLAERGKRFQIAIMSSDQLADICEEHAELPLTLGDYECLFASGGPVSLDELAKQRASARQDRELAQLVSETLTTACQRLGPVSAEQIQALLTDRLWPIAKIQKVLDFLCSDLVCAIKPTPSTDEHQKKYVPATSIAVTQLRLRKLADSFGVGAQEPDGVLERAAGRSGASIGREAAVAAVREERDSR